MGGGSAAPMSSPLLASLTKGNWEGARDPWWEWRSQTSLPFHLCLATLRFSSRTICLPTSALPSPRPPRVTLFIPLAPAPEEERAGPPPQEGRWGRAAPAGREGKGGKEVANRRRWNPVGGLRIVFTSSLFSSAKSNPRPSQNPGSAATSQDPCRVSLSEPGGGRVQCVPQTIRTRSFNVSISFCFFSVQQSHPLFYLFSIKKKKFYPG